MTKIPKMSNFVDSQYDSPIPFKSRKSKCSFQLSDDNFLIICSPSKACKQSGGLVGHTK